MKNSNFNIGNLVTGIAFRGIAEIQGKNNLGQFECVTESGDSFFVLPENLTLYSDYEEESCDHIGRAFCESNNCPDVTKWTDGTPVTTDSRGMVQI